MNAFHDFLIRAGKCRRIGKSLMQGLLCAREPWTGFTCLITHGHDKIEFLHDLYCHGANRRRLETGAENFYVAVAVFLQKTFWHLTAGAILRTDDQHLFFNN